MPTRLWLSHWFSTAYHFIQLLRNNPDGRAFHILGTNEKPNSVVLTACDHAAVEPAVQGAAYVEYALDFCRQHGVEVFIPSYKKLDAIAAHLGEFNARGIKVLAPDDAGVYATLNDKPSAYASVLQHKLMAVPEYRVVSTPAEFRRAHDEIRDLGHQVCFKPRASQGGAGFRILDPAYNQAKTLYYPSGVRLSFEQAYRLLETEARFPELLMSEYLDGPEYSIDCLGYAGELYAAVPRRKLEGRMRLLEHHPELLEIARRVTEVYRLPYIFNIQVRYRDGVPKLLEVNPRMSGGLYISCLSGVNFPYQAVKLLLEGRIEPQTPRLDLMVGEVEAAVVVVRPEPPNG